MKDDIDEFLSSDLELSFASTMSLNSPSRQNPNITPESERDDMMDISPAPIRISTSENAGFGAKPMSRPRANTSAARLFGRDVSNDYAPSVDSSSSKSGSIRAKRTQRAALPMEWLSQTKSAEPEVERRPPMGLSLAPSSPDAMDIDDSFSHPPSRPYVDISSPAPPLSAAPTITGFDNIFDAASHERSRDDITAHPAKKRRSTSPQPSFGRRRAGTIGAMDAFANLDSSPAPLTSPSDLKLERIVNSNLARLPKPMLGGIGNPSENPNKRPRRPMISSMVAPSDTVRSAYPVLGGGDQENKPPAPPAPRRAFSAMLPPGSLGDSFSDESSFEQGDSPAAAYAKRQQTKTLRRRDGTEDFRPLTGAPTIRASPRGLGLGGFGDNEAAGKILPCHRVREDGLMRIKPHTLDELLDGVYDDQISSFQVIDCRFDYEFNGGHISGAVNINTTDALEDFFLGNHVKKPIASTSNNAGKKKILVFHCEFSVKRAPTFAKHLRSKDRMINNHSYPKVFYPEVYVLEGGYCQYFKESGARCRPNAYVRMDDPQHAAARREDLGQFRKAKFGRTKSYAYGEAMGHGTSSQQQQKRNTAPSGGPTQLFAAANAARTRRGSGLDTLVEDHHAVQSEDEDTDIGDSPCPPPTKNTGLKAKRLGMSRAPALLRAETYDSARFAY
ncbi:hypothetical protein OF83DRAFT_1163716 [Amylostereum chailletii]|nr:hypothetical protein OF83DRAFT_1163716 [Amylostereum chailletii]